MSAVQTLADKLDEVATNYQRALWLLEQVARGEIHPGRIRSDPVSGTFSWISQDEFEVLQAIEREKREKCAVPVLSLEQLRNGIAEGEPCP